MHAHARLRAKSRSVRITSIRPMPNQTVLTNENENVPPLIRHGSDPQRFTNSAQMQTARKARVIRISIVAKVRATIGSDFRYRIQNPLCKYRFCVVLFWRVVFQNCAIRVVSSRAWNAFLFAQMFKPLYDFRKHFLDGLKY